MGKSDDEFCYIDDYADSSSIHGCGYIWSKRKSVTHLGNHRSAIARIFPKS